MTNGWKITRAKTSIDEHGPCGGRGQGMNLHWLERCYPSYAWRYDQDERGREVFIGDSPAGCATVRMDFGLVWVVDRFLANGKRLRDVDIDEWDGSLLK